MAINAMIPLQAQAADPLNALASGYQLGNTIRQQPMVDKMNQQKLDAGEIDLQNAKFKQLEAASGMDKTMLKSAYYGAAQIAPYLASGDMASVTRTIEQRKQAKQLIGMPTDTEDNFLKELQSNPEQAKKSVANMMAIGQQLFGKSQASRSVALNPGGQLYSQDGTLLAQNNNAKPGAGPQGKSVDAWAYNVLLNGDPSSKEFAAAKAHLSRSRTQLVQTENGLMPVSQPGFDLGWAVDGSNGQGAIPPPNPVGAPAPSQSPSHGGQVPPTGNVIPGTGKPATEDQSKAGGWLRQATNAYKNMTDAIRQDQGAASPTIAEKIAGKVGTEAVNAVASPQRQRYINAASEFSEAVLRAATGAGVTIDEAKQKIEALTPGYFDSPELVAQKQQAMQVYLDSLRVRAGSTAKYVENPVENTDPLGLFK